jgi:hypothetical protein
MFVFPAVSSMMYSAVVNFTRMRKFLETPVRTFCIFSNPSIRNNCLLSAKLFVGSFYHSTACSYMSEDRTNAWMLGPILS